ncbi:amino acid permease [Desulforhopalus singaporensis]|uniref:Transporter, cation-chloride cotransporter (CCC) family n=1 Tax=Desulforhopalus singaporensis TaxID=91360 RepID=A0A1H0SF87_9BACT|nr:amino acid permease [Desulforhopalus singaporensis]SDP40370.1 transporter, cation-chloride cotransporter (CCC) family [Desulforhopalus singaporensis]
MSSSDKRARTPADDRAEVTGRLSTFGGVYTPSILTILGIILFLRLGYVTGSCGVGKALLLLAIANVITIITSQSLAAIATNIKVQGGGDYYLISRTLGYKFGGAIGIVLYLAQSVSVAFYCIGFGEAVHALPQVSLHPGVIAAGAIVGLFFLAWLGADWATRFQYVVMFLIGAALFSFFLGGVEQWQESMFVANWLPPGDGPPFWAIFAVFFPAVTGFTQGVSMSGDLKDPGKSLPVGTFSAVATSIVVYFAVIVVFGGTLANQELATDYRAMQKVARYGFLIDVGVIAATLSSAMASFMGAPRILQSLGGDRIFPLLTFFAKGAGPTNNPRRGVLLTGAIALVTINLGQLNLIAQVVSIFFLISYGLLNYATYFEAATKSPSFRPRFRFFNKYVSLAGCLLCGSIIIALDTVHGIVAFGFMFSIYLYLKSSAKPARWADAGRSYAFSQVRRYLQQMSAVAEHQNDWYPHLLAFTNHSDTRQKLLTFGDWICGDTGLMSAVRIVPGSGWSRKKIEDDARRELVEDIAKATVFCFPVVVASTNFASTFKNLLLSHGVGPLQPNSVLVNWYRELESQLSGLEQLKYGHNLRSAHRLGYNLIVFHCDQSKWDNLVRPDKNRDRIDIWWEVENNSSRLMLLLAYLVTRNPLWKRAKIRVITESSADFQAANDTLMQFFDEVRIPAQPLLVENIDPATILEHSLDSALVFMPFKINQSKLIDITGYSLERVLPRLHATALVHAAEEIDLDARPEEGVAGELAEAMDELFEFQKRLARVKKEEKQAVDELEKIALKIGRIKGNGEKVQDFEDLKVLEKQLQRSEQTRERLFRKSSKIQALHDDAVARVRELGGSPEQDKG